MKAKIGILSEGLDRKRMIRIAEGKVTSEEPYPLNFCLSHWLCFHNCCLTKMLNC
ncbi:hypothetical protein ACXHQO_04220 [Vibrio antiquarius]